METRGRHGRTSSEKRLSVWPESCFPRRARISRCTWCVGLREPPKSPSKDGITSQIEEAFKNLAGDLAVRPIFHQLENKGSSSAFAEAAGTGLQGRLARRAWFFGPTKRACETGGGEPHPGAWQSGKLPPLVVRVIPRPIRIVMI